MHSFMGSLIASYKGERERILVFHNTEGMILRHDQNKGPYTAKVVNSDLIISTEIGIK